MESGAELFDKYNWQVDLHLRDKPIEYRHQSIRIIQSSRSMPADILITNEAIKHCEFVFWHCILGASVAIRDTVQYSGFSLDSLLYRYVS